MPIVIRRTFALRPARHRYRAGLLGRVKSQCKSSVRAYDQGELNLLVRHHTSRRHPNTCLFGRLGDGRDREVPVGMGSLAVPPAGIVAMPAESEYRRRAP